MTGRSLDAFEPPPAAYFDEIHGRHLDAKARADDEAKAAPFYEAFESRKAERRRTIRSICEKLQTGPIVISTFNWGFRQLVENWAASCDRHRIDCRRFTLLFPTDERADTYARSLGFHTYFDGVCYGDLPVEACKAFGDSDFRRRMFAKVATTQDVLQVGVDVLRQDVDMVWLRDPQSYLSRRMERESLDFLFMDDGSTQMHRPLHYNSGFAYISNNPFARYAWDQVFTNYARIIQWGSEQRVVNAVLGYLRDRGLRSERLPEQEFVNGHVIARTLNTGTPFPAAPTVIHASWTKNIERKLVHLKQFGHWYI